MPPAAPSPWNRLVAPALLSATLGLAPFTPEPHIVGKLRWVAGGAVGMGGMDWFDLLLHGTPFVYLLVSFGVVLRELAAKRGAGGREEPTGD
jgi:hypothetical protein